MTKSASALAVHPVILSGGVGSRLWPLSREQYPKQFLDVAASGRTLLQQTLERLDGLTGLAAPLVVCNEAHRFLVAEQLRDNPLGSARILLEPFGRNTAPAVGVAALQALRDDADALLAVFPADHLVNEPARLREALAAALEPAKAGWLVTFGITPDRAETGYGYIEAGDPVVANSTAARVKQFVEKPNQKTAEAYLASGGFYWNSGMFVMRASTYLEALQMHAPEILRGCEAAMASAKRDLDFIRLDEAGFSHCPNQSIDYAVMEPTDAAAVLPLTAGWSDLGSWTTLMDAANADTQGNVLLGDVIAEDSQNNYIRAESRLVATVGLTDHVVVETVDSVLIAPRHSVQAVKKIVQRLQQDGRQEAVEHRQVHRPWGSYEGLIVAERFQVKRIVVNPGCRLSLQKHHHRAEHWVVVKGTAQVIRGDESFLLGEDQSTYIPLGEVHRLENPGMIPLELVEVQSGSYLGEDDITRLEDIYGR
ncbi:MAG: mannose-1-phosphate guanylyltransferase/mannose-6-phosphate isomerase [Spiribacter sp.]|jgi:mannose-1-phosphate guanylyltransferase/mannose-6-phosphate isomerase|nr:mannose-1-phosphate guanylyltransferase/mannose-6-phosphate isomerase [Spiribacter sp.]